MDRSLKIITALGIVAFSPVSLADAGFTIPEPSVSGLLAVALVAAVLVIRKNR